MRSRSWAGATLLSRSVHWAIPGLIAASIVLSGFASSDVDASSGVVGNGRWVVLLFVAGLALLTGVTRLRAALSSPYALAFGAWVVLAMVSAWWSVDSSLTLKRAFSLGLLYAATVVLAGVYVRSRQQVANLVLGVLVGMVVVLVVSLLAAWVDPAHAIQPAFHVPGGGSPARFQGITENPNTIASYGFIVLPLVLWRLVVDRGWLRLVWVAAGALAFGEVIWSGTRTSLALMFVELGLFGVLFGGRRGRVAVGSLVAAILLGIGSLVAARSGHADFVVRAATFSNLGGRTVAWRGATHLIARRPVHGYGFGTEPVVFRAYTAQHAQRFQNAKFVASFIHNSYLSAALQLGIPGAVLMGLLLVAPVAFLLRGSIGVEPSLAVGIGAAVVASALNAIMSSYLTSVGNVITVSTWLLAALCLAIRRIAR